MALRGRVFEQLVEHLSEGVCMTLPRQVVPGRTYLLTRRCSQRQLLMRPDAETNNAFIYCLAVAADRFDVDVLFTVAMSNHHHTGIVDNRGNYPEFLEYFHKLFAKCQNTLRRREENFWDNSQASVVRLVDASDVLDKLVYVACNPVDAHLVERALAWPGVSSYRATLQASELKATRPNHFFRADGLMPEHAALHFVRPEGFERLSHTQWCELLKERVSRRENRLRLERARMGLRPAGARAVLAQKWTTRPRSKEPTATLNPRVASKSQLSRIRALEELKVFNRAYQEARALFQYGFRSAVFPEGTYWLKRFANAVCAQELLRLAA